MPEFVLKYLLNIEPAPWTEGGEMRLGWLNLPQHEAALLLLLGVVAAAAAILYLYKREGRMLSRFARLSLLLSAHPDAPFASGQPIRNWT